MAIPLNTTIGTPDETSTSSLVSSTGIALASAAATFSSGELNARQISAEIPSLTSSELSSSSSQATSATANSSSSIGPDSPLISIIPESDNEPLVSIPPYVCSTTINLSTFTTQLLSYIDDTQKDILVHFIYVIINAHAAAAATAPLSPAPAPTRPPDSLGPLFLANLSTYAYTPDNLQSDRANLNKSWYQVDSLHRPADGYYSTQSNESKL